MFNKAARLLPLVGQTATRQSKSLLRPAAVRELPIAGPSRIPSRSLATPSSTIGHVPHPVDAGAPGVDDGVVGSDTFVDAESQAALEKEADAIVDMPPNLRFVDLSGYKEKVKRGKVLHRRSDPLNPILLPLSHLGSADPTGPSPENLSVSLDPTVFSQATRRDILHRNVVWYLSTLRQGNQQTKTRSTVNYSGRKLRRQKGTGKARVGDASSNIRRGGAPAFPLHNRDHAQKINRKVRVLGLRIALSTKLRTGLLRVVQDLDEANWQGTGEAQRALCDGRAAVAPASAEAAESVVAEETEAAAAVAEEASEAEVETAETAEAAVGEIVPRFGTAKDVSILFVHAPIFTPEVEERIAHFERVTRNIPGIELMSTDDLTVWHILKYEWLVMDTAAVDAVSSPEWLEAEEDEWMGDFAAEVAGADAAQPQQVQA